MEDNISTTQQNLQNLYNNAATQLVNGTSQAEVADMLTQNGIKADEANAVVAKMRLDIAQARLDRANKDVRNGALWCVGGLVVTVVSYSMVSEGGGSYFVCWGAVIFGAIQLFRGLSASGTAKKELEEVSGSA